MRDHAQISYREQAMIRYANFFPGEARRGRRGYLRPYETKIRSSISIVIEVVYTFKQLLPASDKL